MGGHGLIKKKLIIICCILSILCLVGLALAFIPNWKGKKDNNTAANVRIYNPVQNGTDIPNVQNPVKGSPIQNTTSIPNRQLPVLINTKQNSTSIPNRQIPVLINPKQNTTSIPNRQNPVITKTKQNPTSTSNRQNPVVINTKQNTTEIFKSQVPVTINTKQNTTEISKSQDPVTINTKQSTTDISSVQYPVIDDNNFDFIFLKMENNKKNMIYSPISIEYALNILKDGAVGSTYDEINGVIGNRKLYKYPNIDNVLSSGNGLFILDIYYEYMIPEFKNEINEKYDAEVIKDSFNNIQNINQWMENKTFGIIKNMLSDDIVKEPNLLMIILNAMAINMEWDKKFDYKYTDKNEFLMDNGERKKVSTLFLNDVKSEGVAYYKDDNITVLTMDLKEYDGIQFEFMAIMPKKNLSSYVENISKEKISEIDKKLKLSSDINDGFYVIIPKFQFSYNLGLKQDLNKLGIKNAFSEDNANFSKMAYVKDINRNLFVLEALHKTEIKFTEEGLKEAAAPVALYITTTTTTMTTATQSSISTTETSIVAMKKPIEIIIMQPFMFIIRNKNTRDIWFTGTVYEPNL